MKSIFCTALILTAALATFAQERTISKEEFEAVLKHPNKVAPFVWREKSYRTLTTTEAKSDGNEQFSRSSKGIIESVPRVASRVLSESSSNSQTSRFEQITIGSKVYKRKDNQAWTVENKTASKPSEAKTETSTFKVIDRQTEYRFLGTETLNNQKTNVYSTVEKIKSVDPVNNQEKVSTITTKYWFNDEGTGLKEEKVSETRTGANTIYMRVTLAWELDPNIRIETPQLN